MLMLKQPQRLSPEQSIWVLGSLCRFHCIPFEPALFLQRHPPSPEDGNFSIADICLAASYQQDLPWLYRDMSFSFKPGKTTLIVGPSGSGKSTLAKLLLGFYRPAEGHILLDRQDVRHFSANELRARFGVVPQETLLFSRTLYDNLQMANPLASFKQIAQACQMAEIHDSIEKLPKGSGKRNVWVGQDSAGIRKTNHIAPGARTC